MGVLKEGDDILGHCRSCGKIMATKLIIVEEKNYKNDIIKVLRGHCKFCGKAITAPIKIDVPPISEDK